MTCVERVVMKEKMRGVHGCAVAKMMTAVTFDHVFADLVKMVRFDWSKKTDLRPCNNLRPRRE